MDAAADLFSLKGYHKTTLRDIAKASGINLSYLYKYVSSKDDIFYLYYHLYMQEISAWYQPYVKEDGSIDQEMTAHKTPVDVKHNYTKSAGGNLSHK